MNKILMLNNTEVHYTVRKSKRAKRVALAVHADGGVVLTLPHTMLESVAEKFLREKSGWLLERLSFFKQFENTYLAKLGRKDYMQHKEKARALAVERVEHFNAHYRQNYNRISIRNQKTCWGSCSSKRNLNFNYKVLFLPEALRDYVIVHELCHLQELNHSIKFWELVARTIPDYKDRKKELDKIS